MKTFIAYFSCIIILIACFDSEKKQEKKIESTELIEPREIKYVELINYYPSTTKRQSNFFELREIESNDTIYVVENNQLNIPDFIKNYKKEENSEIAIQRSKFKKKTCFVYIPNKIKLNSKKLYFGEIIRLID